MNANDIGERNKTVVDLTSDFQIFGPGPNGTCDLLVEIANGVCHAYLRDNSSTIVGDVWLYNVATTPETRPWAVKSARPPFLNPSEYINQSHDIMDYNRNSVSVKWVGESENLAAIVCMGGKEIAKVSPGEHPGYSALVQKNGPLARVWDR